MATYQFPSLNLNAQPLDNFQYGLGNALGTLGYGDASPSAITANAASGLINNIAEGGTPSNQGMANLFQSLFSQNSMFGGVDEGTGLMSGGWVSPLASLGSTLFGAFQGNQKLKLAQDQFDEQRRQFDANYNAQRQTTNTQLEDRQRARVASNPGAYESVDTYLDRNRIK